MTVASTDGAAVVPSPPRGHVLDNPAWASLTSTHTHLAERHGGAARFRTDVSPFAALADPRDPQSWRDLAALVGPSVDVVVTAPVVGLPAGWTVVERGEGLQFVGTDLAVAPDPEAVPLGPQDAAEMLDLVARTQPGPFLPNTVALGGYLGFRDGGRLVAMAGRRLRPPGWTEISAVCTDPQWRGRGLATRLVRAVGHGIVEDGDRVFLHTASTNETAVRLYESIGFHLRRRTTFALVRTPAQ